MSASKPRDDRRSALVMAAYGQIARHGFEGLRTRDVAAEVGVNVATLHYYFPTKEKLIEAVVDHAMSRFRTTLETGAASRDLLGTYLRGVRKLLTQEPELGTVMGELSLRSARDPELARIMQDMNEARHRTVRAMLKRAAKSGQIARDLDADGVAALIVVALAGLSLPRASVRKGQALLQLEDWVTRRAPAAPRRSSN
jgi:AcrR family transcriptional regulator